MLQSHAIQVVNAVNCQDMQYWLERKGGNLFEAKNCQKPRDYLY